MTTRRTRNEPDPESSLATIDGYIRLACGILLAAVKDLVSDDPVKKWDSLYWLAADPTSRVFCDVLGLPDPLSLLRQPGLTRKLRTRKRRQNL